MNTYVESLLNGAPTADTVDLEQANNARERFEKRVAKRLLKAHALAQGSEKYTGDFLLALRDYLLAMNTSIRLERIQIPDDNPYGISKDASTGLYFASDQLPEYVTEPFVRTVFSHPLPEPERQNANLATDPMIEQLTGYSQFKSLAQKLSVYGALNTPEGYTTLVALPTGGGKSLITQTLAYQQNGLTIVVVPTVALAIDQVRTARKIIRREHVEQEIFYYSSNVDPGPILNAIEQRQAKLLFISPETLMLNQSFQACIQRANERRYLKNIVIDEAHIVVDWGASFRVEYQCLESWREKLIAKNPGIRTMLLSATFEKRCVEILRTLFSQDGRWIEVRCDALRREPRFIFVNARSNYEKNLRMIEMVRKLPHPMIIYVAKPAEAEFLKKELAKHGICNVETFTGTTPSARRRKLIDRWVDDQFQILIATSAFGVGVDKGDVRTVLHMYVPQNANAYYQELGRGGRDGLPCLSVMCINNEDTSAAFQRISKRVMTVDKLMGRWSSMFNDERSVRKDSLVYIDTSIKPNYSDNDEFDDTPTSEADRNWNIYVLLFLRRNHMIRIRDVIWVRDQNKYIFVIQILSSELLDGGEVLRMKLESLRQEEWDYYFQAFETMRKSVRGKQNTCWSEMFFNTYEFVGGYCAGCRGHVEIESESAMDYPLKRAIHHPVHRLEPDQLGLFGGALELIVIAKRDEWGELLEKLMRKRMTALVVPDCESRIEDIAEKRNLLILGRKDLGQLMQKDNLYYVSGLVAVIYEGTAQEIVSQYRTVKSCLLKHEEIRVVHILQSDIWLERYDKKFSDLVDGKVLRAMDIKD